MTTYPSALVVTETPPPAMDPRDLTWGMVIPVTAGLKAMEAGGPRISERCVEIPLALEVMQLDQSGRVLDAGCALLGALVAVPDPGWRPVAEVTHLTQAIGSEVIRPRGRQLSFVSADLRDLSIYADRAFDRTVCVSTLEHVGYDNTHYGGVPEHDPDSVRRAWDELRRVTKGPIFVTVPCGGNWPPVSRWHYFTEDDIERLWAGLERRYYGLGPTGWYGPSPTRMTDVVPAKVNQIVCLRA